MRIFSTSGEGQSLDPMEFLERVWVEYDQDDRESFIPLVDDFRKVANNVDVFLDRLHTEIKEFATGKFSQYAQASILVGGTRGKRPYLRANIWPTVPENSAAAGDICKAYSYYLAHNHNFSFITTGYLGNGYQTEVWTIEKGWDNLRVGGSSPTRFEGRHRLDMSTVVWYEAHKDIHIQYPPNSLSLSLNLMLKTEEDKYTDQYFFEPKGGEVVGIYSQTLSRRRALLLYVASLIGDGETIEILQDISRKSPDSYLRQSASRALEDRARILECAA